MTPSASSRRNQSDHRARPFRPLAWRQGDRRNRLTQTRKERPVDTIARASKVAEIANPAVQTAIGPMVIVALDQRDPHPLVHDELAARMLPGATRAMVSLARWRPLGQSIVNLSEKRIPGLWASILCRKRYVDDVTPQAMDSGVAAVVILGAGLDTRAYRLAALARTPVYEVDLPTNIDRKKALVTKIYGAVPDHVKLVPTDFETQQVADTLSAAGYQRDQRTMFVMEAVTQYLTEASVRDTFGFLSQAPTGSHLVFTHIRQDFLDGQALYGADVAYQDFVVKQRLWKFGMHPHEVAGFLTTYGWRQLEQAGPREFTDRYLKPNGRDLPVSEIERSVHAQKV